MPVRTFDYCALQFLNQWLEKEEGYCIAVASPELRTRRQGLVSAGGHFRIARNLPTEYEASGRYQVVLDAIDEIQSATAENVVQVIADLHQKVSTAYGGRNVLSAVTKFLWLKLKAPIRIYDSQARRALGTSENDYAAFYAAFTAKLINVRGEIEDACSRLSDVLSYSATPTAAPEQIRSLTSQSWFRERVLDIYLWNVGNA